jgi:transaldolase
MGVDLGGMLRRRAVFLDRDGVINTAMVRDGKPYPPASVTETVLVEHAAAALARLSERGFLLIVVTNQPDVRRGSMCRENVEDIHRFLATKLPIDDFFVCYHDDEDHCGCRKPQPGLLREAADKYQISLAESYLIGDRWRDIGAGAAAGCRTVFIDRGYNERGPETRPDIRVHSLSEAVDRILEEVEPELNPLSNLKIKIFADGANLAEMCDLYRNPIISGFTTNPTLMRKAGITGYERFASEVLAALPDRPISFEVFSDEFQEMERQALKIAGWGTNVFVKIPVTNTRGEPSTSLICRLSAKGVKLNVTALMTLDQVIEVSRAMIGGPAGYVSMFAGRIADTGRDPVPIMREALAILNENPKLQLIWASPREVLNIFQADAIGCHVITATRDILDKLPIIGKPLEQYSLETVKMFRDDAVKAGFHIDC